MQSLRGDDSGKEREGSTEGSIFELRLTGHEEFR